MVRNDLPPAGTEEAKPDRFDIGGLNDKVAARTEEPSQLAQLLTRVAEMLDDVVEGGDIDRARRESCRGKLSRAAIKPFRGGNPCRMLIGLDAADLKVVGRSAKKFPRRATDLKQPPAVDKPTEVGEALPGHRLTPGGLGLLDVPLNQTKLTSTGREALHLLRHSARRPGQLPLIHEMEAAASAAMERAIEPVRAKQKDAIHASTEWADGTYWGSGVHGGRSLNQPASIGLRHRRASSAKTSS